MTAVYLILRLLKWLAFAAAVFCFLSLLLLGGSYAAIYAYSDGTGELPADCAIVFGAAVYGRSTASPALTRRTAAAANLYREGQIKRIIFSGGKGSEGRSSEAA